MDLIHLRDRDEELLPFQEQRMNLKKNGVTGGHGGTSKHFKV